MTVVLAGITVWSGLDTKSNPGPDKVRTACVGLGESCPEYQDGLSRQKRTNVLQIATGVGGLATAVIGGFLTNWSGAPSSAQGIHPVVGLGPGSATVHATGRF